MAVRVKRNPASNDLWDSFRVSQMQYASVIERLERKYMSRELSGRSSEIIDFGRDFDSKYPKRRCYGGTAHGHVQRTFVKETIKEMTFDNPMDYLNYVLKKNKRLTYLFEQQGRLNFVPKLALLPEEFRDDESTLNMTALHRGRLDFVPKLALLPEEFRDDESTLNVAALQKGSKCMRSRSASPCNSEQVQGYSAISGYSLFLSCRERSRERTPCSPFLTRNDSCSYQAQAPLIPDSLPEVQGCSSNLLLSTQDLGQAKCTTEPRLPSEVERNPTVSSVNRAVSKQTLLSGESSQNSSSFQSISEVKKGKSTTPRNCRNGPTVPSTKGTVSKRKRSYGVKPPIPASSQSVGEMRKDKKLTPRDSRSSSYSNLRCKSLGKSDLKKATTSNDVRNNGRILRPRSNRTPVNSSRITSTSQSRSKELNKTVSSVGRRNRTVKGTAMKTEKLEKSSSESKLTSKRKTPDRRRTGPHNRSRISYRNLSVKKNPVGSKVNETYRCTSSLANFAGSTSSNGNDPQNCLPSQMSAIPNGLWSEDIRDVLKSYDATNLESKQKLTILGLDAEELRKATGGKQQQTTLRAFLSCMNKPQTAHNERFLVDNGLKEDRRAIAAAKSRNRRLTSGYCD